MSTIISRSFTLAYDEYGDDFIQVIPSPNTQTVDLTIRDDDTDIEYNLTAHDATELGNALVCFAQSLYGH